MPRDAVSRTANVGTVGKNGLSKYIRVYLFNIDVELNPLSNIHLIVHDNEAIQ